jgi:hypothetical protein
MTHPRTLAAASLAALSLLAACNSQPVVVGETADPQAEALKNAPPVQLPPSIKVAKTYRCRDNSLVHVTFMTDNTTAVVRQREGSEPPVATLRAPAAGQPFTADGYTIEGDGANITYTSPSKGRLTCRSS